MATGAQAAGAPSGRASTPYTERLVTHVTKDVARRLRMQAALEGRPSSHLLNEVLAHRLMTLAQVAEQMQHMGALSGSNMPGQ